MEQSFSFRWIKLGIGLIFLLGSSLLPNLYLIITLGGIAIMTAFASFGNYDYRGEPSKLPYRIVRHILAVLIFAIAIIQIYVQIAMPNTVHYSPYYTVIDVSLIAYLLMYKPSNSSTCKKILKVIGYTAILIGVNALQNSQKLVEHLTYSGVEINWGAIFATSIVMIIGIVFLLFSNKNS
ncbi:MAG: hypothetical protein NC111_05900 [Bacteroides sp.]|nr:hypothetical protein [Bacteroides sp.]MCM1412720.1 hypothetical protein [Bacteroides sp.]MCM1472041.1 hypothetical protein [Bacteroides sp.]